jgi:hypothetical protein
MRPALLWVPPLALAAVALVPTAPPARAAAEQPLVEKVRKSIDSGVSFLRSQQRRDGGWEVDRESVARYGGWSALAVLALLNAGVKSTDPAVASGLEFLRKVKPERTYTVGLQTMVFVLAGQKRDQEAIQRNVQWLLEARAGDGWTYGPAGSGPDNSNTQYALLGLHEAIQSGVKVSPKVLEEIRSLYLRTQFRGGWGYRPRKMEPTVTMSTAGLCNLLITGMDLEVGKAKLRADGSAEHCGEYKENEPVTRALDLLGRIFPARLTEGNVTERLTNSPFYALYGIERAGRLTGQRYLGGHDWYEVGCRYLVESQQRDGSWEGRAVGLDHWPVVATSFSLLFLSKGRTPVLVSKLAYGDPDYTGWNNKRSDMRHLVEFCGRELFKGRPLAWQAFDVRRKRAEGREAQRELAAELLQSPVVYFNGHDFAPGGKEKEVLREYVANGGFILAENCCGKARHPRFDADFRALIKDLFPDSELQPLEPEHPVWLASGKFEVSPRDFPLEGVKQGCKTVVIYSPVPLAGYWEANQSARGKGRKAFEAGASIIAYATGLEPPRPRLTEVDIVRDDHRDKGKRGYLRVGQLRHEGDWQPAPKAMKNLMAEARKVGLDVALETTPLYASAEAVKDFRFLYLHGRNDFRYAKGDLKHLRFGLKSGGTLLADACCGSEAFDKAFREFMRVLWADDKLKLEPIPPTDHLFSAELNGEAIKTVRCRRKTPGSRRVDPMYHPRPPELEGVKYNGRWVVIYSRYDLGCALERHTAPDCLGHDHASAVRLAKAAVLYALKP